MRLFRSTALLMLLLLPASPAGSADEAAGETVECANLIYAGSLIRVPTVPVGVPPVVVPTSIPGWSRRKAGMRACRASSIFVARTSTTPTYVLRSMKPFCALISSPP